MQIIFKRGCTDALEFTEPLPVEVLHPMCWADSMYSMRSERDSSKKTCFFNNRKHFLRFFAHFLYWFGESIQYIQWGLNDTLPFLYLSPGFHSLQKVDIQCLCNDGFARFDGSLYDGWWLTGERNETVKMALMALTRDKIGFTLTK